MGAHVRCVLFIAGFSIIGISGVASVLNKQSLGVDPRDLSYYKSSVIRCKHGSKKFTSEQLNDDFCDCQDGTDEPGTSACPLGKFYCENVGHIPLKIFSSRVNDGICDCCDGSDEYNSNTNCPNTCSEAGKADRDKLKKKIETYKQGIVIRNKEVEKAKQAYAEDEKELVKLKSDEKLLKYFVQKLRDQKERIDKAEEEERLKKEKEEKKLRKADQKSSEREKKEKDSGHDGRYGSHDQDDTYKFTASDDSNVEEVPPSKEEDGSDTSEGLSKEELGHLVASRWTGEDASQKADKIGNIEEDQMDQGSSISHEHHSSYTAESQDNGDKYEDDVLGIDNDDLSDDDHADSDGSYIPDEDEKVDPEDITDSNRPSWLDKIQQTVQNVLQAFNFFKTPVNMTEAAGIRKEFDDNSSKLSKIQSRISSLTEKLKHDFGQEKEFYLLNGQCFKREQNMYVYRICPFKQASQKEGYSNTQLGDWNKFEESYRVMLFSNGDGCWNGPDRSLKVRLSCGLKNEIIDVDEPSRCEYTALMATPTLCLENKLRELERTLDQLNTRQPDARDEL